MTNHKIPGIKRSLIIATLVVFVTIGSVFAINNGSFTRNNLNNDLSIESLKEVEMEKRAREVLLEDLNSLFNGDQYEQELENETDSELFEIYDAEDNLIVSVNKEEWENNSNEELSKLKSKAEFIFEIGNLRVYKVL